MPSELTIITIIDNTSRKAMKLQGKWTDSNVQVLLNDGFTSWTGSFNFVDDVSEDVLFQLELDRDCFLEKTKMALGSASLNPKFRYTFENDRLTWAEMVTPDVYYTHGSIALSPVAAASHGELIRSLLDSYGSVLEELSQSIVRYNRLEKEYQEINSAFEDCARLKIEMESALYTKFALILNEKKEYVRRVTGEYPKESFGPKPSQSKHSDSDLGMDEPKTTSVSLRDFSKMIKRDSSASGERPAKKQMVDIQPGPSWDREEMEF